MKTMFRSVQQKFFPAVLLLASATVAATAFAATEFEGMHIEVIGKGQPVVMIPGLNSGGDTWRDTCEALREQLQCHMVTLPGFAGQPAVEGDAFLEPMRDRLLAYIAEEKLEKPPVIGHSLGGVLAMQMGIAQPASVGKLLIVDSLPFFAAIQDPAMTVETMRPMAEQARKGMTEMDDASYVAQADASVAGMTRSPERVETLKQWGRDTDRKATVDAMYDMMVTDLREDLARIQSPTRVLGSWAGYAAYGATQESTRAIFEAQYARLPDADIRLSKDGYHFLMWDDPQWVQEEIRDFLALD